VKYGVGLPTGGECGDPHFLVELAVLAEKSGWDGVFLDGCGDAAQLAPCVLFVIRVVPRSRAAGSGCNLSESKVGGTWQCANQMVIAAPGISLACG
jgi:hypothetical protein